MGPLLRGYLTSLEAAGASPGTVRLRRHYLERFMLVHPGPIACCEDDLARFLSVPHWSAETRKSARASLRSFYVWLYRTHRIEVDPSRMLPTVRVPRGVPRPAGEDSVRSAIAAAPERERLMLMLAAYAGLRCCEIARVHSRDVQGGGLLVHGKGGTQRLVPLHPSLAGRIARIRGYAFPRKGGHLSAGYVSRLMSRALPEDVTGHMLRHRFASAAYAHARDIRAVQELLGHASPTTTARYTAVPDQAKHDAVMAAGPEPELRVVS